MWNIFMGLLKMKIKYKMMSKKIGNGFYKWWIDSAEIKIQKTKYKIILYGK